MKNGLIVTHVMLVLVLVSPAGASEIEAQQKSETEKSTGLSLDEVKNFLGLSLILQASYLYNFEDPKDHENPLRVFDHRANSFVVDLAEIQLLRKPQRGEVGYKLKIAAGEYAKFTHSRGLGTSDDFIDLPEAYVEYVAPLGTGLAIRFGKFATYHGAEVLEVR